MLAISAGFLTIVAFTIEFYSSRSRSLEALERARVAAQNLETIRGLVVENVEEQVDALLRQANDQGDIEMWRSQ